MRILISVDAHLPIPPKEYGGIERIVDSLVKEFQDRGHSVGLVAVGESTCSVDTLFPWAHSSPETTWHHLRNAKTLARAAREFAPDVIHSFSRLAYLLPSMRRSMPKIMSYQRYTGGRQIRIASILAARSLVFTGCSQFIAELGRRWGGEWRAIHNFTDTSYFDFAPTVEAEAPLVFLSRIERIKGAHTAIQIARACGRRLLIAGNRVETEDGKAYWDNKIAPHLGTGGIEYVGPVNDEQKRDLLRQSAALVVPVEWDEPFGIVFVEALACGTPVISCPRGALPEIVQDGVHGFLIGSLEQGVAAVNRIENISRIACREHAERSFSSAVIADNYIALYSELVSRPK